MLFCVAAEMEERAHVILLDNHHLDFIIQVHVRQLFKILLVEHFRV